MLPNPCWSLSSAFVSSLRFQLLKTSGKLQLLNWSDTELPTFSGHQGSPVTEIVESLGMLQPQQPIVSARLPSLRTLASRNPDFALWKIVRATGLHMDLSLLSTVLFGRKKWKKKVTNSWPKASASCGSCRISGSHSWPLEQWSIATASKWYWL